MKEQNKKLRPWMIAVCALLGFAVGVIAFVWRVRSGLPTLVFLCVGVFYGLILFYGLRGYRTPHGNMVQILMLILAVYVAASAVTTDRQWGVFSWIILLANNLAAVFMGFMAGRLHKVEENQYTAILVSVLLFVRCFWFLENLNMSGADIILYVLDRCLALLAWIVLVLLYFFRYEAHRRAGETELNRGDTTIRK